MREINGEVTITVKELNSIQRELKKYDDLQDKYNELARQFVRDNLGGYLMDTYSEDEPKPIEDIINELNDENSNWNYRLSYTRDLGIEDSFVKEVLPVIYNEMLKRREENLSWKREREVRIKANENKENA